ncbi:MAG: transaldolase [Deltaproteobacteria bacterium]|nr:transaldolase [Deltaproteobacteria bacterium]
MNDNPLRKLREIGQSIWLDNLSRDLINSGELKRLIEEGVTGITSNPTIFQKAISGSKDYDASLKNLLSQGIRDEKELFLDMALEDISRAADLLWPVYQSSNGLDGYVSIEVSPDLAYDTEKTVAEARRLFSTIGKKNILVKVPATPQGLPAIEQLITQGVNVNVTLLFSIKRYQEISEAYLHGLEARVRQGQAIQEIASVASFFVSRVDTVVDKLLQNRISSEASEPEKQKIHALFGKAAVANARIAYKKYKDIFTGTRFQNLPGARIQRILWGSTGTKNPNYSDVKYVQELIGPDSINTIPETTLQAFMDHGRAQITIGDSLEEAQMLFNDLNSLGVDIDQVTSQLEQEGVKLFADSYFLLLKEIAEKRDSFLSPKH